MRPLTKVILHNTLIGDRRQEKLVPERLPALLVVAQADLNMGIGRCEFEAQPKVL